MTSLKELYGLVKPSGLDLKGGKWYRLSWRPLEEEDAERACCDAALSGLRDLSQTVEIHVNGHNWTVTAIGNPGVVYAKGKGTSLTIALLKTVKKM